MSKISYMSNLGLHNFTDIKELHYNLYKKLQIGCDITAFLFNFLGPTPSPSLRAAVLQPIHIRRRRLACRLAVLGDPAAPHRSALAEVLPHCPVLLHRRGSRPGRPDAALRGATAWLPVLRRVADATAVGMRTGFAADSGGELKVNKSSMYVR